MPTPGVGVLIDTERLKSSNKEEQVNPYFLEVDGQRYYGSNPEDTLREAKKALTRKQTTNIIPPGVKKQEQTSITDPMDADLKLLGLSKGATVADIKDAWKKIVKRIHSNKGGTGNVGSVTDAKNRLLERLKNTPAAPAPAPNKQLGITNPQGGGKMRKSLKRKRVFRKKRSTTRKHLK
jgi:hypothetical protein